MVISAQAGIHDAAQTACHDDAYFFSRFAVLIAIVARARRLAT